MKTTKQKIEELKKLEDEVKSNSNKMIKEIKQQQDKVKALLALTKVRNFIILFTFLICSCEKEEIIMEEKQEIKKGQYKNFDCYQDYCVEIIHSDASDSNFVEKVGNNFHFVFKKNEWVSQCLLTNLLTKKDTIYTIEIEYVNNISVTDFSKTNFSVGEYKYGGHTIADGYLLDIETTKKTFQYKARNNNRLIMISLESDGTFEIDFILKSIKVK